MEADGLRTMAVDLSGVQRGVGRWFTRPHFAGDLLVHPDPQAVRLSNRLQLGSVSPQRVGSPPHRIAGEKPVGPHTSEGLPRARGGGDYVRATASSGDRNSRSRTPAPRRSRTRHSPLAHPVILRQNIALSGAAPLVIGGPRIYNPHPPASTFGGGQQKSFAIVSRGVAKQMGSRAAGANVLPGNRRSVAGRGTPSRGKARRASPARSRHVPEHGFGGVHRPISRGRARAMRTPPTPARTKHQVLDVNLLPEHAPSLKWWSAADSVLRQPQTRFCKPGTMFHDGVPLPATYGGDGAVYSPRLLAGGEAITRGGSRQEFRQLARDSLGRDIREALEERRDRRLTRPPASPKRTGLSPRVSSAPPSRAKSQPTRRPPALNTAGAQVADFGIAALPLESPGTLSRMLLSAGSQRAMQTARADLEQSGIVGWSEGVADDEPSAIATNGAAERALELDAPHVGVPRAGGEAALDE